MKKQVTLGVQGLTDLENYLKQYERAIKQTRKELVDELCVTGEALLAEYSPVEDHELKSSTASLVQHGPKTSRGVLFQAAPHAPFVEFGTGLVGSQSPHPDSQDEPTNRA